MIKNKKTPDLKKNMFQFDENDKDFLQKIAFEKPDSYRLSDFLPIHGDPSIMYEIYTKEYIKKKKYS